MYLQFVVILQTIVLVAICTWYMCRRNVQVQARTTQYSNISALHFRMKLLDNYKKCLTGMAAQTSIFSKIDGIDKKLIEMTNAFDISKKDNLLDELSTLRRGIVHIAKNIYDQNTDLTESKKTLLEYIIHSE